MSTEREWPGPRDLIEYLKQPGRKKAEGQFAKGEGRCCLGHYADMCGLEYPEDQGAFGRGDRPPLAPGDASLPPSHWLLTEVGPLDDPGSLQGRLAIINDASEDFGPVIERLEQFALAMETPA